MPVEYMITFEPSENIDHSFVAIVEQILDNTLQLHQPAEVYVVQIDNWFDHKWLEFDTSRIDTDDLGWRAKLMLPPFEPSRVVSQLSFKKHSPAPLLYEASSSNPLHLLSSNRSLAQICSSGAFVWYSYVGNRSDQGSLMVYLNDDGKGSAWYASFTKNPDWQVNKMKGVSKRELTELMTIRVTTPGI
ncbi:MAG: hypothetical protein WAL47_06480 [Pyrinomonadaceae bacterium]